MYDLKTLREMNNEAVVAEADRMRDAIAYAEQRLGLEPQYDTSWSLADMVSYLETLNDLMAEKIAQVEAEDAGAPYHLPFTLGEYEANKRNR